MMRTYSVEEVMVEILDLWYKLSSPLSCQPSKTVFLGAGNLFTFSNKPGFDKSFTGPSFWLLSRLENLYRLLSLLCLLKTN
jgi:hypothetical protein